MHSETFQLPNVADLQDWKIVENALQQLAGMRKVEVHRPTRLVTVQYSDPTTRDDILRTLGKIGFVPDMPGIRGESEFEEPED